MKYAGFWKRFVAMIIDAIIFGIAGTIVLYVITGGDAVAAPRGTYDLLIAAIAWLYFALMESSASQGTIGKMALGIKVTGLNGNRISFWQATGRYFGKYISALIVFIGFFMAGFTAKKQALHDMLASTLVVNK